MELFIWHSAGSDDQTKLINTPPTYHCLFKEKDGVGINKELINNYRIHTEDKQVFINTIVDKLREALETAPEPFSDTTNIS